VEIWRKPTQFFEPQIKSWRTANVLVFAGVEANPLKMGLGARNDKAR
jgi:hypothetical protein